MDVVLLGTGSADGWPNAFCRCASCAAERSAGRVRLQTCALVDGVLLLDCGPTAPFAAGRAGRSLAGVRHLLLTHAHVDHTAPAALLWRAWAERAEPLTVHGPAAAVEACRPWLGPRDPVTLHEVRAGEVFECDGYRVAALPATHGDEVTGECVLWDVTGPDAARLLYATDTGPLSEGALASLGTYDLLLLEETFGDAVGLGGDHHDLRSFPATLAELRRRGAVTPATRVVAIHLSHHNPPTSQLRRRLAPWGAEVLDDATLLQLCSNERGIPPIGPTERRVHSKQAPAGGGGRTFVVGGARSGKSGYAEALLADRAAVTYVATGGERPGDEEWSARVAAHRRRRPPSWRTVEAGDSPGTAGDPAAAVRAAAPSDAVLIDCLTLWLTRLLDVSGAWEDPDRAAAVTDAAAADLVAALRATPARVVVVSNEVGQGIVPATRSGRVFRDELGRLNAAVAAACEEVVWLVAGRALALAEPSGTIVDTSTPDAQRSDPTWRQAP